MVNNSHPRVSSPESHTPLHDAMEEIKRLADRAKQAFYGFDITELFKGRLDADNYFYGAMTMISLSLIVWEVPIFGAVISLTLFVLASGMTARRFHDINVSGWATLLLFVPFVNLLGVIYLSWKKGDTGSNVYGSVPDNNREMFHAWLNT